MKLKHIAAIASLAAAAPAFAATGSLQALYNVTAARTVYISGASALTGSLASAVGALCQGGVANVRTLSVGGSTSDGRVFVCTTSSAGPAAGVFNAPFAVVKRDTNGSFDGVGPVINGSALTTWANVGNCDDVALNCARDTTTAIVPNGGLSDVETAIWRGLSNTGALSQPVPVPTGITLETGFAGQGFGIMVSEELYKAMQTQQKAAGRLPSTCTVGDFTAGACQPSISKAEYTAVVRGDAFNYAFNATLTGTNDPINLCRRVETSGTQAASNAYFLNNPCGNGNPTFGAIPPKAVDFSGGTAVSWTNGVPGATVSGNYDDFGGQFGLFEGSGTGDARNCVIRRNSGNNPNNVADGLGKYAIGFISLENAPAAGWKLIKLDGVSPNAYESTAAGGWTVDNDQRRTVVQGRYDLAPEFELLYPTNSPFAGFFSALKTAFSTPSVLNTRGIFISPAGANTYTAFPTQVAKGTRAGNFCAPQSLTE
ncbi:MAG: hypothetical protein IBJ04_04520 [Hydrogenophaga sp.]|uniref:hypothetical protein n=1 Tax=Hydrogenophaga sp. TaxID=1904254 RepID=UPI00257F72EC|nr:hypothetical protein [Hydrogenophaga sp.]MBL0943569.1 hypothetical protein [Hydrogenophaga sp.]